jgi:hypothetical protein
MKLTAMRKSAYVFGNFGRILWRINAESIFSDVRARKSGRGCESVCVCV